MLRKFNSLNWQYLKTQYLLYQDVILKGKRKLQRRQTVKPYILNTDSYDNVEDAWGDVSRQKMKFRRLNDAVTVDVQTGETFNNWLGTGRVQEKKRCNSEWVCRWIWLFNECNTTSFLSSLFRRKSIKGYQDQRVFSITAGWFKIGSKNYLAEYKTALSRLWPATIDPCIGSVKVFYGNLSLIARKHAAIASQWQSVTRIVLFQF